MAGTLALTATVAAVLTITVSLTITVAVTLAIAIYLTTTISVALATAVAVALAITVTGETLYPSRTNLCRSGGIHSAGYICFITSSDCHGFTLRLHGNHTFNHSDMRGSCFVYTNTKSRAAYHVDG